MGSRGTLHLGRLRRVHLAQIASDCGETPPFCREQCIESSSPTDRVHASSTPPARVDADAEQTRWNVGDRSGQTSSSGGVIGLPADIAHQRTFRLRRCARRTSCGIVET